MIFNQIDTNRNGLISCEEAFIWSEEPFLGKAFDPRNVNHPYGISDPSKFCKILKFGTQGGLKWPLLKHNKNLKILHGIFKERQIDPSEFDYDLHKLSEQDRNNLINDVQHHPIIHYSK